MLKILAITDTSLEHNLHAFCMLFMSNQLTMYTMQPQSSYMQTALILHAYQKTLIASYQLATILHANSLITFNKLTMCCSVMKSHNILCYMIAAN